MSTERKLKSPDFFAGHAVFSLDEAAAALVPEGRRLRVVRSRAYVERGQRGGLLVGRWKHKPLRAVFRDDAFESDSVKINVEQIFKLLSQGTEVKSI